MKVGKREQLVFGSVGGIVAIIVLHLFIFQPKASLYSDAKTRWEKAREDYLNIKATKTEREIDKYNGESSVYQVQFDEILNLLNLKIDPYFMPAAPDISEADKTARNDQVRQATLENIDKLLAFKHDNPDMKLTFFGADGWDVSESLPKDIVQGRLNLADLIDQLRQLDTIIKVLKNETIKTQKEYEFKRKKLQLGINEDQLDIKRQYFGDGAVLVKLLTHAEMIWERKPQDLVMSHDELYRLLGVELPEGVMVHINKQIIALVDILEKMKKDGVMEVSAVKLDKTDSFYRIELPGSEEPAVSRLAKTGIVLVSATPTATPAPAAEGAATPAPTPKDYAESFFVGSAAPIKIIFTSSNLNSSKLIYDLSFGRNIYNIDDIMFQAMPNGNVQVTITVNVPTYLQDVSF
ncbi:MAG: hypothetical protein V2A74_04535 [bacterium]